MRVGTRGRLSLQRCSSQVQGGRGPAALTPITERTGYFAIGGLQGIPGVRRRSETSARERAAAVEGGVRRAQAPRGGSTTIVTWLWGARGKACLHDSITTPPRRPLCLFRRHRE